MKKNQVFYIVAMLMAVMGISSCSETDDSKEEFVNWQEKNDSYFSTAYQAAKTNANGTYKLIHNWSFNDSVATDPANYIVVKVLNEGKGSGCPLYTDSVRVHYEGRLIPSTSYPSGWVFDSSWSGDYNLKTMVPVVLSPSNCVDGFATALQNMHIGDRWQVTIPYQLGYGTNDYSSSGSTVTIPGYSNLVFDITLVAYYRAGASIPSWKAKAKRGVESTSSTGYWVTE